MKKTLVVIYIIHITLLIAMIMGVPVAVPVKWKIEFCWTLLQPFESFNRSTLHQCAFAGKLQIWVCNFHGQLKVSKAGVFDFGETDLRNRLKQTLQQTLQQTPHFCPTT